MTGTGVCAPMICWRLTRLATAVRCDDRAGGNRGTLRRLSGPFQQVDRLLSCPCAVPGRAECERARIPRTRTMPDRTRVAVKSAVKRDSATGPGAWRGRFQI
jgi:hypothetical protein